MTAHAPVARSSPAPPSSHGVASAPVCASVPWDAGAAVLDVVWSAVGVSEGEVDGDGVLSSPCGVSEAGLSVGFSVGLSVGFSVGVAGGVVLEVLVLETV